MPGIDDRCHLNWERLLRRKEKEKLIINLIAVGLVNTAALVNGLFIINVLQASIKTADRWRSSADKKNRKPAPIWPRAHTESTYAKMKEECMMTARIYTVILVIKLNHPGRRPLLSLDPPNLFAIQMHHPKKNPREIILSFPYSSAAESTTPRSPRGCH